MLGWGQITVLKRMANINLDGLTKEVRFEQKDLAYIVKHENTEDK